MAELFSFAIDHQDKTTRARCGRFETAHGTIRTPVFMPVGTQGAVKAVLPRDLSEMGAQVILANTYHLYLRPGAEVIERQGGLHRFAAWPGTLLTDSGGFQVFSLKALSELTEEGVRFQSHVDGSYHLLTPERSVEVQRALGSDIAMVLDVCPAADAPREEVSAALERSTRWADRCLEAHTRSDQALFGIVQGGLDPVLRRRHAEEIAARPFPGLAIGGLSVGEPPEKMWEAVAFTAPHLPAERPRYLMGVGTPEDLVRCIGHGIDMFDCVIPTRNARRGTVYTRSGKLNLRNARFRDDPAPLDPACGCLACREHSRAYLRHLVMAHEIGAGILCSIHNLTFYMDLIRAIRDAIELGRYGEFQADFLAGRGFG